MKHKSHPNKVVQNIVPVIYNQYFVTSCFCFYLNPKTKCQTVAQDISLKTNLFFFLITAQLHTTETKLGGTIRPSQEVCLFYIPAYCPFLFLAHSAESPALPSEHRIHSFSEVRHVGL